jgi:hypothetical protein
VDPCFHQSGYLGQQEEPFVVSQPLLFAVSGQQALPAAASFAGFPESFTTLITTIETAARINRSDMILIHRDFGFG